MDFLTRLIHALTEVHPLHTLIVHFPIALTASAFFFVLLALWRRKDVLEQVAFANISLAAISTVAAAFTGMRDNLAFYDGGAPNANVKMILATILFLVTTITAVARWRNTNLFHTTFKWLYVTAYFVSFALAAVLGFLGGVILYGF